MSTVIDNCATCRNSHKQSSRTFTSVLGDNFAMDLVVSPASQQRLGLTTPCGQYFEEVSKEKLQYKKITLLVTVAVEFIISLVGVDSINLAVPVLTFIFPIMIALHSLLCLRPIHPIRLDGSWSRSWSRNRRPCTRNQHLVNTRHNFSGNLPET